MAKSQQTFNKKEREKKRQKKKKEKLEKREQRKLEKIENGPKSFEDMITYVDYDGNPTKEKPDPSKRVEIKVEDIVLGVPPNGHEPMDPNRTGMVKFFNNEKGYGFIVDSETKESIFSHINNIHDEIRENDKVTFEVEMGPKGPNAVNVRIAKDKPKPKPVPKPKAEAPKPEAPVAPKPEAPKE